MPEQMKPSKVLCDHYAVARLRDGKVVECLATHVKLPEVLRALAIHRPRVTQRSRQSIRLLQRVAEGFRPVRMLGAIVQ